MGVRATSLFRLKAVTAGLARRFWEISPPRPTVAKGWSSSYITPSYIVPTGRSVASRRAASEVLRHRLPKLDLSRSRGGARISLLDSDGNKESG